MCAELGGLPWVFHGFDTALEVDRAWRDVIGLPGLESVVTAGSTRGLAHGADELIQRARRDPRVAELALAGGGLTPDLVPWLVAGGRTPVRDRVLRPARRLLDPLLGRRRTPCARGGCCSTTRSPARSAFPSTEPSRRFAGHGGAAREMLLAHRSGASTV